MIDFFFFFNGITADVAELSLSRRMMCHDSTLWFSIGLHVNLLHYLRELTLDTEQAVARQTRLCYIGR